MNSTKLLLLLTVWIATARPAAAENWPAWRGPQATGISTESNLPERWSNTENIRWKVALPEPGNSTPIIWGDRVFLTQALDAGKRRALVALDRKSGKKLWQQEVVCDVEETHHKQNPPCSSSPVTDGKAVYAQFFSAGVVAYDFEGKRLWHRQLGPVIHRFGNGSSPVIYKHLLILFHGPGEPKAFLTALDRRTGETVWEVQERALNHNLFGSWATPVVIHTGQRDELLMPLPGEKVGGQGLIKSYDPLTGKLLWRCDGLGTEVYAMPIVGTGGKMVVGICGHQGPTMAVRTGGSGDVTETHRVWRNVERNPQRVGSGVIYQGHLYLSDAPGFLECLDMKTGQIVWKERLGGNLWGSVLLGDGKLYVTNLEGDTFVVAASPKFKLIAKNSTGETTYAALAPSDGELFLRTHQHIYCIGKED